MSVGTVSPNHSLMFFGRLAKLLLFAYVSMAIMIYFVCSPIGSQNIYRMLLFPAVRYPVGLYNLKEVSGIKPQNVFFPAADGSMLHGWFFGKPGAKRTVVFHHGQGQNLTCYMDIWAKPFLENGMSFFVYDYRGYGRSEGKPTVQGIAEDGISASNYIQQTLGLNADQIVQCGASLGTGVACAVAQKIPSAGVVLISPYASLISECRDRMPWLHLYPKWLFPEGDLECVSFAQGNHVPLLILHGTKDWMIQIKHSEEIVAKATQPVRFEKFASEHVDMSIVDPARTFAVIHDWESGL